VFEVGAIHPFCSPLAPPSNEKEIRCFGLRAFTPLIPLCPTPKTEKEICKFFKTIPTAVGKKKRNTSANSVYAVPFVVVPPPHCTHICHW